MTAATWTPERVRALGVRTDVRTAGSIFGLKKSAAYKAIKADRFPVPWFRNGRSIVVPVQPILDRLGIPTS